MLKYIITSIFLLHSWALIFLFVGTLPHLLNKYFSRWVCAIYQLLVCILVARVRNLELCWGGDKDGDGCRCLRAETRSSKRIPKPMGQLERLLTMYVSVSWGRDTACSSWNGAEKLIVQSIVRKWRSTIILSLQQVLWPMENISFIISLLWGQQRNVIFNAASITWNGVPCDSS